jgi:hypothetical protein
MHSIISPTKPKAVLTHAELQRELKTAHNKHQDLLIKDRNFYKPDQNLWNNPARLNKKFYKQYYQTWEKNQKAHEFLVKILDTKHKNLEFQEKRTSVLSKKDQTLQEESEIKLQRLILEKNSNSKRFFTKPESVKYAPVMASVSPDEEKRLLYSRTSNLSRICSKNLWEERSTLNHKKLHSDLTQKVLQGERYAVDTIVGRIEKDRDSGKFGEELNDKRRQEIKSSYKCLRQKNNDEITSMNYPIKSSSSFCGKFGSNISSQFAGNVGNFLGPYKSEQNLPETDAGGAGAGLFVKKAPMSQQENRSKSNGQLNGRMESPVKGNPGQAGTSASAQKLGQVFAYGRGIGPWDRSPSAKNENPRILSARTGDVLEQKRGSTGSKGQREIVNYYYCNAVKKDVRGGNDIRFNQKKTKVGAKQANLTTFPEEKTCLGEKNVNKSHMENYVTKESSGVGPNLIVGKVSDPYFFHMRGDGGLSSKDGPDEVSRLTNDMKEDSSRELARISPGIAISKQSIPVIHEEKSSSDVLGENTVPSIPIQFGDAIIGADSQSSNPTNNPNLCPNSKPQSPRTRPTT